MQASDSQCCQNWPGPLALPAYSYMLRAQAHATIAPPVYSYMLRAQVHATIAPPAYSYMLRSQVHATTSGLIQRSHCITRLVSNSPELRLQAYGTTPSSPVCVLQFF